MKNKKILCMIFLLTLIITLMSACKFNKEKLGEEAESVSAPMIAKTKDYPVEIQIGEETYTILEKPKKVAILSPDIAEMLVEMGLDNTIVALGEGCVEVAGFLEKPTCGNPQAVNLEKLREIQPNLILVSSPMRPEQMEPLLEMSVQIIELPQAETLEAIYERMKIVSEIMYGESIGLQKSEKAIEEYKEKYNSIISPVNSYISSLGNKKKVLYLGGLPSIGATPDTFEGMLLDNIQVENVAASGSSWNFDGEKNISEAEIIFYDEKMDLEVILNDPLYKESTASTFQQIYPINFAKVRRKNLGMLDELEKMAQLVYPEAMASGYTVGEE